MEETVRWLLLVTIVFACRRSSPTPTPTSPIGDAARDVASAESVTSMESIVQRASELHMIVDTERGPICQRWHTERKTGFDGSGFTVEIVQDSEASNHRFPIHLKLVKRDQRITIGDPRALVHGTGDSTVSVGLGSCTHAGQWTSCDGTSGEQALARSDGRATLSTDDGARLFLDGRTCRAALASRTPKEPTICPVVLSRHPDGVEVPPISKRFADVLEKGGKLFQQRWPYDQPEPLAKCEEWTVQTGARRSFIYHLRTKQKCLEEKEGYFEAVQRVVMPLQRSGSGILWGGAEVGPKKVTHDCPSGSGVGQGHYDCAGYLPLIGGGDAQMMIGRDRWYLDRASCEREVHRQQ